LIQGQLRKESLLLEPNTRNHSSYRQLSIFSNWIDHEMDGLSIPYINQSQALHNGIGALRQLKMQSIMKFRLYINTNLLKKRKYLGVPTKYLHQKDCILRKSQKLKNGKPLNLQLHF